MPRFGFSNVARDGIARYSVKLTFVNFCWTT